MLVEDRERYNKSEIFHRVLGPILGEGILTSEGEHWRHQRQIAAPIFRPDRIESYVQQILTSTESEADRLAKMPAGTPISLSDEMKLTTLQIFAATFLSGTYRFDVEAQIEASKTVVGSTGWVIALANIGLPASFPYPGRRRVTAAANYVRRVASDIVTARTHQSREDDLLQSLIDSRDEGSGEAMSDPEIIDNLVTFMSAGHDTTALALTWTFYLLSIHPEVEERVLAEIEDAGGAEGIVPEASLITGLHPPGDQRGVAALSPGPVAAPDAGARGKDRQCRYHPPKFHRYSGLCGPSPPKIVG